MTLVSGADLDVDDLSRTGDQVPPMFLFRDRDGNTLLAVETA